MQYFNKIGENANWQKYLADEEHASVQAGEQSVVVEEEVAEYVCKCIPGNKLSRGSMRRTKLHVVHTTVQ